MAADARWEIRLEYVLNDRSDPGTPVRVVLEMNGSWVMGSGQRPVDECIAISLASLMRMLEESGQLIRPGGMVEVARAFSEEVGDGQGE